jgi:hypothetical protein
LVSRARGERLIVAPVSRYGEDNEFIALLRSSLGRSPEFVDLVIEGHGSPVSDEAINAVARTDPRNIQEVAATQFTLSNSYYQNVLDQARRSFVAAAIAASLGVALFFLAVGFALTKDKFDAAVITTVGGGVVEVIAGLNFWLYSRTALQLNAFHIRLERMQKYLLANSVCANLNGDIRDETMSELVRTIAADVQDPAPAG